MAGITLRVANGHFSPALNPGGTPAKRVP